MLSAAGVLLAVALAPPPATAPGRLSVQSAPVLDRAFSGPARERFPELRWGADGCAAGFQALLAGTADVVMSTRAPNERELRLTERLGLRLYERVLGIDALAVIVHPDNRIDELTLEQLVSIYTGGVVRWMGVGGADESTTLLVPSRLSGMGEVFRERGLGGRDLAASVEWVEPVDDIVGRVASDVGAVGFVSVTLDRARVKTLKIDGVVPTPESVVRGAYPLWYSLRLYTVGEPAGEAHRFLSWLLLQEGRTLLLKAGFLPVGTQPLRRAVIDARRRPRRVLFRAHFGPGSARLARAERDALETILERARSSSDRLLLVGHAAEGEGEGDGYGYEYDLAEARARAVSDLVTSRGLSPDRLELESVGAEEPISAELASNRRVDIWFLPSR